MGKVFRIVFIIIVYIIASPVLSIGLPAIAISKILDWFDIDIPFAVEYAAMIATEIVWFIFLLGCVVPYLISLV